MLLSAATLDVFGGQNFAVAEAFRLDSFEEAKDRGVGLRSVGHKQIGVLGRPEATVGNHREPADNYVLQTGRMASATTPTSQARGSRLEP
ncbi:MAG TPA: hypothetical protein VGH58_03290 [Solirubrobacterales bacterium]|jgi:hypothetical protein